MGSASLAASAKFSNMAAMVELNESNGQPSFIALRLGALMPEFAGCGHWFAETAVAFSPISITPSHRGECVRCNDKIVVVRAWARAAPPMRRTQLTGGHTGLVALGGNPLARPRPEPSVFGRTVL